MKASVSAEDGSVRFTIREVENGFIVNRWLPVKQSPAHRIVAVLDGTFVFTTKTEKDAFINAT